MKIVVGDKDGYEASSVETLEFKACKLVLFSFCLFDYLSFLDYIHAARGVYTHRLNVQNVWGVISFVHHCIYDIVY